MENRYKRQHWRTTTEFQNIQDVKLLNMITVLAFNPPRTWDIGIAAQHRYKLKKSFKIEENNNSWLPTEND